MQTRSTTPFPTSFPSLFSTPRLMNQFLRFSSSPNWDYYHPHRGNKTYVSPNGLFVMNGEPTQLHYSKSSVRNPRLPRCLDNHLLGHKRRGGPRADCATRDKKPEPSPAQGYPGLLPRKRATLHPVLPLALGPHSWEPWTISILGKRRGEGSALDR